MPNIEIFVNGRAVKVTPKTSVAAAVLQSGESAFRRSVTGEPRAALCGMGICYECRVTIDGVAHSKSCQILCCSGMKVVAG